MTDDDDGDGDGDGDGGGDDGGDDGGGGDDDEGRLEISYETILYRT